MDKIFMCRWIPVSSVIHMTISDNQSDSLVNPSMFQSTQSASRLTLFAKDVTFNWDKAAPTCAFVDY